MSAGHRVCALCCCFFPAPADSAMAARTGGPSEARKNLLVRHQTTMSPEHVNDISILVQAFRASKSFDQVGLVLLRFMLELVTRELASSGYAGQAQGLRGLIHLRTEDTYRQVLAVSQSSSNGDWMIEQHPTTVSSARKWRWVAEHQSAISVDLPLGKLQHYSDNKSSPIERNVGTGLLGGSIKPDVSAAPLEATHLFSAPLRAPGGVLDGMACIEVTCAAALGKEFIWERCTERLQLCCDLASPYLLQLPGQAATTGKPDEFLPVIGSSMVQVVQILRVFAWQDETLLIGGQTGVGKSRLAHWCHQQSPRKRSRFETIDLTNVPENLQMAELCGWKKGAFTDAMQDTPGALSRAEGGTLFIDEIDKLSLKAQAGLLRILEERRYRPLGERRGEHQANVRFVIGTNADLHRAVQAGRFREDLYYRINVLPVKIPPLCERRDEIIPWARYMAQRRHGKTAGTVSIAAEAEQLLQEQPWPGNLRQLDNIIRRAYALALLEERSGSAGVMLNQRHVERALQWEIWPLRPRPLPDLLMEAAEAFVRAAQLRTLDLDMADAFRGFVLAAAVQRLGDRDAAFRLLGKEQMVRNRNHHKVLKREIERTISLFETLGETPQLILDRLERDEELESSDKGRAD